MFLRTLLVLPLALAAPSNPTTITLSASAAASTPSEYADTSAFKSAVLNSTNTYRAQHNASALSWNTSLATFAANWGRACVFEHSGGPNGENLASGYMNATSSIEAWGNERSSYSFSSGKFSKKTGHFTQLVWKATTSVGCSRTDCSGRKGDMAAPGWFVICEYYPPGNVIGAFKENVQSQVKSKGKDCPQGGVCGGVGRLGVERVWGVVWVMAVGMVIGLVL